MQFLPAWIVLFGKKESRLNYQIIKYQETLNTKQSQAKNKRCIPKFYGTLEYAAVSI
jgi:hypothetical protein